MRTKNAHPNGYERYGTSLKIAPPSESDSGICGTDTQAGLVDPAEAERRAKKNQWKGRFDERNTQSTLVGAALEEGESGENYVPESDEAILARERRRNEGLWGRSDEEYYNEGRCRQISQ